MPFRSQVHPFRSYEMVAKSPRLEILHFARHFEGCFAAAKPPFSTQVPLRSAVRPFRSCEMGYKNDAEIPLAAKSTPPRCEKSRLLGKGTMTLGVPFKRYKFHFSYSKPSFELQKGTKRIQARAPSHLPPPPEQAARISNRFR